MHQVHDCVGKYHGQETVVGLVAVIKDTNRDATYRKEEICMLFSEAGVVVKKTAVTNHDWVGCERVRETRKKKNEEKL